MTPLKDLVRDFNALPRPQTFPHSKGPSLILTQNHWHISVRSLDFPSTNHFVFLLQSQVGITDVQGPIEKRLPAGQLVDLQSDATILIITRLILEDSINRNSRRPWTWVTNDVAMGDKIISMMRRLGVEEPLNMPAASDAKNRTVDETWSCYTQVAGEVKTSGLDKVLSLGQLERIREAFFGPRLN